MNIEHIVGIINSEYQVNQYKLSLNIYSDLLPAKVRAMKPQQQSTTAISPRGGGGGYSHTLRIRVCAARRGRDFEAPDLERGIHFRGVF